MRPQLPRRLQTKTAGATRLLVPRVRACPRSLAAAWSGPLPPSLPHSLSASLLPCLAASLTVSCSCLPSLPGSLELGVFTRMPECLEPCADASVAVDTDADVPAEATLKFDTVCQACTCHTTQNVHLSSTSVNETRWISPHQSPPLPPPRSQQLRRYSFIRYLVRMRRRLRRRLLRTSRRMTCDGSTATAATWYHSATVYAVWLVPVHMAA
jgi:hypothetical protein